MASTRINALATTATSPASDDFVALDGTTNGTRKWAATHLQNLGTGDSPSFTGLTATGHVTFEGVTSTGATGSGKLVFDTSPTFVTPALGTPASGVVTNLTGTASININGTVGATTPTTGAFTTLSATVADGTYANRIIGATGRLRFLPYLSGVAYIDAVNAAESAGITLNLSGSSVVLAVTGTGNIATVSSTGLAVTGSITATTSVKVYSGAAASLPSANPAGQLAFMTDATSAQGTNSGATLVSGGSNYRPVYSDGTNWKYF
jgi:hypothetical protein